MSTGFIDELVMLHGWGMNAAVWNDCDPAAWGGAAQHRIELPGHGNSPFLPSLNTLWRWADACLEAAPPQAVWLGWSLGGLVALAAALRAPKRVTGLILLTATPRFVQAVDWSPAMPETTLTQFYDELRADPSATLARFLALQVRGSESARDTLRQLRAELATKPVPQPAALALGLELLRDEDLRGQLPDIRCPALWLFGSHDALVPAKVAERVEVLMPGAQTEIIAGAAHAPHLSHPLETARAMRAFFATLPAPA
ncbi:pimeloyl-[acyl-carrier protein] methyl ester esterase [Chromatium okenii]|uniref:pimeloyl-ACP methyl ester esterase BioH n=1 Tax=Chromatium okenii TaxID=61644 RepID=UPI001902CEF1|nr:pimeloyl-ACP methyl ester esterase BioH [Chromatium okenii]MBK1641417.1 pimeloyl-[acyl-carrier protein] methyl ester esterase [Chromatium okenii]